MYSTQQKQAFEEPSYESYGGINMAETIRVNFVRKVFGITAVQLVFTSIFTYFSITHLDFTKNQSLHMFFLGLSALLGIGTMLALAFSDTISRKVPVNYILLAIFTLSESYWVSFSCSLYDKEIVLMALFLTAAVVTVLTVYALTTKTEVSYFGGLISLLSLGLFASFILSIFVKFHFLLSLQYAAACVIEGLYLIYDVKRIMGKEAERVRGRRGGEISLDDYIRGAMNLYIDIIRIFLKILQFLSKNAEEKDNKKNKNN